MSDAAKTLPFSPPPRGIIYGPVTSRRLGQSLGINLLGDSLKACSFNCSYCDLGPTEVRLKNLKSEVQMPTPEQVHKELADYLKKAKSENIQIDWICLSGNGEPTLYEELDLAIDGIISARDNFYPQAKLTILTNVANADQRKVRLALDRLDERIVKLDAGNDRILKELNSPLARSNLAKIIMNAKKLKDCIIQSMFVQGVGENTKPQDIEDWMEAVALVKPKFVQITGMTRMPANPGTLPVPEDTLYFIASKLERRTQIKAQVFL